MSTEEISQRLFEARRAGVLLHPTALGGEYGILGATARRFVDFMAKSGLSIWQTLPVGPTHSDLSPYQSLSAHAGHPDFIDLSELVALGLIRRDELDPSAERSKQVLVKLAARRFFGGEGQLRRQDFEDFCSEQGDWLDDFSIFCGIRETLQGMSWTEWPAPLRDRHPEAVAQFVRENAEPIQAVRFEQFLFRHQWQSLKAYAAERGVLLFGDIPIFVAHDSADVWANRHLFKLDREGNPTVVAGVPPDYFSSEGQHWGNPIYDWDAMAEDGYQWWLQRLESQRQLFDLIRIDHFRGLESFWEIPEATPQPRFGYWAPGPGRKFLNACFERFPGLPLVAENLGIISDEVEQLRREFRLPGMTVIQFGFDGNPDNPHLLHRHQPGDLVYTGTHDNDTSLGWYQSLDDHTRTYVNRYLGTDGTGMPWPIVEAAFSSVCWLAMVPMQDFLGLGSEARFNTPGTVQGNWVWQLELSQCTDELAEKIREAISRHERIRF